MVMRSTSIRWQNVFTIALSALWGAQPIEWMSVMSNKDKSPHYGALQQVIDSLFRDDEAPYLEQVDEELAFKVSRLDVIIAAESADLPEDLMRIVSLLPPGDYTRRRLTDQINSAINGHAWGQVYGTVT